MVSAEKRRIIETKFIQTRGQRSSRLARACRAFRTLSGTHSSSSLVAPSPSRLLFGPCSFPSLIIPNLLPKQLACERPLTSTNQLSSVSPPPPALHYRRTRIYARTGKLPPSLVARKTISSISLINHLNDSRLMAVLVAHPASGFRGFSL